MYFCHFFFFFLALRCTQTNYCAPVLPPQLGMLLVAMEKCLPHRCHHHGNGTGEVVTWGHVSRELHSSISKTASQSRFRVKARCSLSATALQDCAAVLLNQFHCLIHDQCIYFSHLLFFLSSYNYTPHLSRVKQSVRVFLSLTLTGSVWLCNVIFLPPSCFQLAFMKIGVRFVCCVTHPPTSPLMQRPNHWLEFCILFPVTPLNFVSQCEAIFLSTPIIFSPGILQQPFSSDVPLPSYTCFIHTLKESS